MTYAWLIGLLATGMMAAMLLLLQVGRRLGDREIAANPGEAPVGLGAVEGYLFGLLGLLVAFTFTGAASRFDARRTLIVQESNAIGTAYLRIDLLPESRQPALREKFRNYLDSRLAIFRRAEEFEEAMAEVVRSTELQGEIWSLAVAATNEVNRPGVNALVLTAVNEMIDITSTRMMAAMTHPPKIIFGLLFLLSLGSALLAGYGLAGGKSRGGIHMIAFAALTVVAIYVILDIEYPRLGLIRVDSSDQVLIDLRSSMK